MALSDREYARGAQSGGGRGWSANTWIIVINLAVYAVMAVLGPRLATPVLVRALDPGQQFEVYPALLNPDGSPVAKDQPLRYGGEYYRTLVIRGTGQVVLDQDTGAPIVAERYRVSDAVTAYGHFSTFTGFVQLQVWRLVTFQFVHASMMHVVMNMFGLYIFGPPVEEHLGRKKYLAFYLTCGIFGGLGYLLLNLAGYVAHTYFGVSNAPFLLIDDVHTRLVGASAGVFGVIMACARLRPDEKVQLIFPPVSIPMRVMAFSYVLIAAVNLFLGGNNAGGDAAHIGGAIAGFYFILRPHLLTDFFDVFTDSRRKAGKAPPARAEQSRMDALLDKVTREGRLSLTDEERAFLAAEAERMRLRGS